MGRDRVIRQSFGQPRQMGRLIVSLLGYSARLHYFAPRMASQPEHEHPWWYLSIVLWGGYIDTGGEVVRAPTVAVPPAAAPSCAQGWAERVLERRHHRALRGIDGHGHATIAR